MFKKIRSNRNPRDTLYSELKKELSPYLTSFRLSLKKITQRYPRFLFAMMVINITLSAILVITIHKPPTKKPINFDPVIKANEAFHKTLLLKRQVDSILSKKTLSKQDSATLEKALDQLKQKP